MTADELIGGWVRRGATPAEVIDGLAKIVDHLVDLVPDTTMPDSFTGRARTDAATVYVRGIMQPPR